MCSEVFSRLSRHENEHRHVLVHGTQKAPKHHPKGQAAAATNRRMAATAAKKTSLNQRKLHANEKAKSLVNALRFFSACCRKLAAVT